MVWPSEAWPSSALSKIGPVINKIVQGRSSRSQDLARGELAVVSIVRERFGRHQKYPRRFDCRQHWPGEISSVYTCDPVRLGHEKFDPVVLARLRSVIFREARARLVMLSEARARFVMYRWARLVRLVMLREARTRLLGQYRQFSQLALLVP